MYNFLTGKIIGDQTTTTPLLAPLIRRWPGKDARSDGPRPT
jgi:hypothetical protein